MLHKLRDRAASEKGFTLIELLVVILIIGILAAIALPAFLNQRAKAQDTEAKTAARTAQTAMETYYTDEQTYSAPTRPRSARSSLRCPRRGRDRPGHLRPVRHRVHDRGDAGEDRLEVHDHEGHHRRRDAHLHDRRARRAAPPALRAGRANLGGILNPPNPTNVGGILNPASKLGGPTRRPTLGGILNPAESNKPRRDPEPRRVNSKRSLGLGWAWGPGQCAERARLRSRPFSFLGDHGACGPAKRRFTRALALLSLDLLGCGRGHG